MRVLLIVVALVVLVPLGAVMGQPDRGSNVRLVVLPPWQNGASLVDHAGGRAIGPQRAPFAVLARADDVSSFDSAARRLGAWFVWDGAAIAALCGVSA